MHRPADLQVNVALVTAGVDLAQLGEVVERLGGRLLVAAGLAAQVVDGQPQQQRPLAVGQQRRVAGALLTYSLGMSG